MSLISLIVLQHWFSCSLCSSKCPHGLPHPCWGVGERGSAAMGLASHLSPFQPVIANVNRLFWGPRPVRSRRLIPACSNTLRRCPFPTSSVSHQRIKWLELVTSPPHKQEYHESSWVARLDRWCWFAHPADCLWLSGRTFILLAVVEAHPLRSRQVIASSVRRGRGTQLKH
jgi:hypothetical protein